jgi:hypothetical protein
LASGEFFLLRDCVSTSGLLPEFVREKVTHLRFFLNPLENPGHAVVAVLKVILEVKETHYC